LIESVNATLSKNPDAIQEITTTRSFHFTPLFRYTERNLEKAAQQVRYDILLKKFATSLAIYCGPMTYNFIAGNLSRAIPSLRTVQLRIHSC